MADIAGIVESIKGLTLLEASQLVKELETTVPVVRPAPFHRITSFDPSRE